MSIIKTSNILTFVVDDPQKGFANLYPLKKASTSLDLTEPWHLPRWLNHYSIEYNIVDPKNATPDSWYPVGINFWDLEQDYLSELPGQIHELLALNRLRLLFTYREADDPEKIQDHIIRMCEQHNIDQRLVLFISGNTTAKYIPGCMSFWYFDTNYFFQTLSSPAVEITGHKSRKITCLNRTHKHWRECFVYNITKGISSEDQDKNYISYGTVENLDLDSDFIMWQPGSNPNWPWARYKKMGVALPDQTWRNNLPLKADSLNPDQHNDHRIVVQEHYQDSYWNIVLETLLDGGVFITEKTLKPIRNGQSFVVLGCQHSLSYLQEQGYRTFGHVVDESYDRIENLHDRWYAVYELTKTLLGMGKEDLHEIWQRCVPMIDHNQQHFQRSREPALRDLVARLVNYRP